MNIKEIDVTIERARNLLYSIYQSPLETEMIEVKEAKGRVLVEDQFSKVNLPVVRSSMMDGIAVKSEEWNKSEFHPEKWIYKKDFVRADTGDDFSDEFDCVIAIEDVLLPDEGGVVFKKEMSPFKGMNVNPSGKIVKERETLLTAPRRLNAIDLAVLHMGNIDKIKVYRQPKVTFVPTGSELITVGEEVKRGQNIDINSIMAKGLLEEWGAKTSMHPIVKDDLESLENMLISTIDSCDILLINGGSSKGEEDYGLRLLEKHGEILFHWSQSGPGRPVALGNIRGKAVVIVPGPPYGCFNVLQYLIRPAVYYLQGIKDHTYKVKAKLVAPVDAPTHFAFLLGAKVWRDENNELLVELLQFKKTGVVSCLAANGYVRTIPGAPKWKQGDMVEVSLLRPV